MRGLKTTTALALIAGGAAFAATDAAAQSGGLDQIVVTARKKEESLQDVPVAITALGGPELERRNLFTMTDLGNFLPNAKFEAGTTDVGGAANATFFIRGIGQLDYAPTTDPGVGLYVDGVFFGRVQGAVMELADIDRIEVLKGPQGTLFGKNTMGGAINVTTKQPDSEFGGMASVTVGEDHRLNFDGSVNVPLSENLASRFSIATRSQDGFVRQPYSTRERAGEEGTIVARGSFLYTPSDATEISLALDYTNIDAESNIAIPIYNDPANLAALWNAFVGFPSNTPLSVAYQSDDLRLSYGTGSNQLNYKGGGVSLKIDHDFGETQFRSISAYRRFNSRNQRDNDGSPVDFGQLDYRDKQWQVSQEFNLFGDLFTERLRYTAGLYFFHEEADSNWFVGLAPGLYEAFEALPGPIFPALPTSTCPPVGPTDICAGGAGNPINFGFDIAGTLTPQVNATSYAAFTELEFDLTDQLTLIAGGRITYDKKHYSYEQVALASGFPTVPLTTIDKNWTDFSPRISLTYTPADDLLFYATVSSGYKAGGFNGRPVNPAVAQTPFDPEKVWSYEIGSKADLANGRLRLNTAGFYYDYQDMQLQANDLIGNQTVQVIDNVGKARIWGVEVDATALLTDQFRVFG
ncbi:MAG TPA: TonB-dependent receptor, partial [Parvularculaceae bacterium]|nr:TonB-dependent receptor [Parvularculaceae bacterium]